MRKSLKVGMLSAGILLIGSSAQAADNWNSNSNSGLGNGNQLKIPVQLPIELCGNAITVGGTASAWCQGGASAVMGSPELNWTTFGNTGLLNGNQAHVPIQIPVDICGNAISILGGATAGCGGGSSAVMHSGHQPGHQSGHQSGHHRRTESLTWTSYGNTGLLNGNQVAAIVQIPVNVCGNAVGVLGGATAGCTGGASADMNSPQQKPQHKPQPRPMAHKKKNKKTELIGGLLPGLFGGAATKQARGYQPPGRPGGHGNCDLNWTTFGNSGLLNGNQVYAPVQVPIDVSGNAVAVGGTANAWSVGGSSATYC